MRFMKTVLAVMLGLLLAAGLLVVGFGILLGLLMRPATPSVPARAVLRIELFGPLWERKLEEPLLALLGGAQGEAPTLELLRHIVELAESDERIRVVWVRLGALEADWARLSEARRLLERLRRAGKWLLASSGPDGFSEAAYYVATVADSVLGPPEGFFEWDGLYAQGLFFRSALDRLGIEVEAIRAGSYKGAVEPFTRRGFSPENRRQLEELLRVLDETLLSAVSQSRGLARDSLLRWRRTATVRSAADAHRVGLLDGLAYEEAIEAALRRRLGLQPDRRLPLVEAGQYAQLPNERRKGPDAVAIVYATGTITVGESGLDPLSGEPTIGSESFLRTLRRVGRDRTVKAVLLRLDSPGGSATASDVMWHAIRELAARKPVVASLSGVAASGGYYLAVAADTIVADPATVTGSIGVFGLHINAGPFLEHKLGVSVDRIKTAPYADWASGLRALSAEERRWMQAEIERLYRSFLARVASGRARPIEHIEPLAQGRIWSGRDAHRLGLVDTLGGFDTALELLCRRAGLDPRRVRLKAYPEPKTLLERLLEPFVVRVSPVDGLAQRLRQLYQSGPIWMWWPFRLYVR